MRSETSLDRPAESRFTGTHSTCHSTAADFDAMQQQIHALEAQSNSLQALICELLHKNQELRAELASLRPTHPAMPNA